jgi:hypothetical protein
MIVCFAIFIVFAALNVLFRRRPPEMTEAGLKHFRKGLLFATASAGFIAISSVVWSASIDPFAHRSIIFCLAVGGGTSNAIGLFYFLRELRQLLPGGGAEDISPAGMILGLVLGIVQLLWSIYGFGLMFAP